MLVKVIRDLFNEDFSGLIVSGDDAWDTINEYVNSVAPELVPKLTKYEPASEGGPDVFAVHRIDEQLAKAMDRKVWLPSGGTLVIDRTEAMTVVDVNTGKFTGSGGNLEQTVTRNNLEAAEEIVRQLRLRDIGGIIVIDFIDMVLESNRDLVLRRLTEALARDRTRHQVSEVTSLGLVQLTRKRLGTGLVEAFSTTCTHCAGRGIVLHADPVDPRAAIGAQGGVRRARWPARQARQEGAASADEDAAVVAKVPAHPGRRAPDVQGDGGRQRRTTTRPTKTATTRSRPRRRRERREVAPRRGREPRIGRVEDDDRRRRDEADDEDRRRRRGDDLDVDLDEDDSDADDDIERRRRSRRRRPRPTTPMTTDDDSDG